jgi:flagellar biosynthesis protein FlhF
MKMRSFTAGNVAEAMEMARNELGEEAVILSTDSPKGGGVVVTFGLDREEDPFFEAPPPPEPAPKRTATGPLRASYADAPMLEMIASCFEYHGVPAAIADDLLKQAEALDLPSKGDVAQLQSALIDLFHASLRFDPLPLKQKNTRAILVGPPGSGKTMTAVKIAAKMVVDNQPVRVVSTDTKRAGGLDQLSAFTKILGIELETASDRAELKTLLAGFGSQERVIIDSAGCNPYDFQELKELGEFARLQDLEPILTCAAGTDGQEATEIASVFSFIDIERVIITRTDCARRYGSLLAIARAGDFAFSHATSSARAMGDMLALDAFMLAQLFTQYQRERIAA